MVNDQKNHRQSITIRFPFSRTINDWAAIRKNRKALEVSGWHFSALRENMILRESPEWHEFYLPICIKDLTILDVGAGEGETARFFLDNGAKKVICIESCHEAFKYLRENSVTHHQIVPINKFFELSDLSDHSFDFLKMDIEGYEESLLQTKLSCPAVIEVHGLQLRDKFKKAGWRFRYRSFGTARGYGCVSYAYWKC
jgi:SAM-dependent methyltransferase